MNDMLRKYYMPSGKTIIIHLIAGLREKISFYRMRYYPKPNNHSRNKVKN